MTLAEAFEYAAEIATAKNKQVELNSEIDWHLKDAIQHEICDLARQFTSLSRAIAKIDHSAAPAQSYSSRWPV